MLTVTDTLPAGLLESEPDRLSELLGGPTLIHLPGRREPPLFVSVLLHGNETSGFYAVQQLLRRHHARLPRSLSLFVGNVAAAARGLRHLDEQPDYNRIWSGGNRPEHAMAQQVLEEMRRRRPFAAIDLHNNTGLNPFYACVSQLEHRFLQLATLFSRIVVYSLRPHSTLGRAFSQMCPAVILECGQSGSERSVEHALNYLEGCLNLSEFSSHPVPSQDVELMHTLAIVRLPEEVSFGFGDCNRDVCFTLNLDHLNFRELPVGAPLARVNRIERVPLEVTDQRGERVTERFFRISNGEICTIRPVIPAMLTLDERIIRQDCLCYLMERLTPPGSP